jgi:hypothetical protein
MSSVFFAGCTTFFNKNNKAGLQVMTNEAAAAVFLDGEYLDNAPYINKELQPGQYLLEIRPENTALVPYETTIELRKGLLTVVTWKPGQRPDLSGGVIYELEKLSSSKTTEIAIASVPDGAVVSIDNGEKEFTPVLRDDITPGTHDIAISLPSYETQSHTVNAVEGHRLNILVTLAKNPLGDSDQIIDPSPVTTSNATPDAATASAQASVQPSPSPNGNLRNVSLSESTDGPTVTITATNFYQDGKEVLRVRDAVGVGGEELGFAEVGNTYLYLDESQSGWLKIDFDGEEGWISSKYAQLDS